MKRLISRKTKKVQKVNVVTKCVHTYDDLCFSFCLNGCFKRCSDTLRVLVGVGGAWLLKVGGGMVVEGGGAWLLKVGGRHGC